MVPLATAAAIARGEKPLRFGAGAEEREKLVAGLETSLLEEAVRLPTGPDRLSGDRLESTFREIAEFSHKIPSLPDEALTRESLYRDYD